MSHLRSAWLIGALATVSAAGCASQNETNGDQQTNSYSQIRERELASERQEFIAEQQEQLNSLDNQISRLEARLQHEAQYVDASQQAEWSQRLFELRQQQNRAQAELERAKNATPAEWAEMRGTVGSTVDSIEAGIDKLMVEAGELVGSDRETASASQEQTGASGSAQAVDLCAVSVDGTRAELVEEGEQLVVRLTGVDPGAVEELRDRVDERLSTSGATSGGDPSAAPPGVTRQSEPTDGSQLVERMAIEDIQDGVSVIFTPVEGQRTALREQLSRELDRIRGQGC